MRRTAQRLLALIAIAGAAAACENGPPWRSDDTEVGVETRRDFGPIAAYDRRLIFLGPGNQLPTAAVFDFTTLADSASVRRGFRARIVDGDAWVPLMDGGWELEPMREPWRIVPTGDLKVVVTDAGEIGAITVQGDPPVRLEPATLIAESSPDAGTQLVLRQATLSLAEESLRGVLLDAQLGRAVGPAVLRPRAIGAGGADTATADTAADEAPATPIARAGAEAFLVNNGGYYAVFSTSAGGDMAWVSHAGRDAIHRGVALEATAWSPGESDEVQMPEAWRIRGPGLAGELTADAVDRSRLEGVGDLTSLGYILASGWIEDRGVRRDVVGLVRHVR